MRLILNEIQKSFNDQNQLYTGKLKKGVVKSQKTRFELFAEKSVTGM